MVTNPVYIFVLFSFLVTTWEREPRRREREKMIFVRHVAVGVQAASTRFFPVASKMSSAVKHATSKRKTNAKRSAIFRPLDVCVAGPSIRWVGGCAQKAETEIKCQKKNPPPPTSPQKKNIKKNRLSYWKTGFLVFSAISWFVCMARCIWFTSIVDELSFHLIVSNLGIVLVFLFLIPCRLVA